MQGSKVFSKSHILFIILGGFFITNALVAEFVGVKIFSLEKSLGWDALDWTIAGHAGLGFNLTCGVLLWPVVFVMTDVINEYYGQKGVKLLSYLAVVMISFAFVMIYFAMGLEPADFWPQSHLHGIENLDERQLAREKVGDYNEAYRLVFGQGLWIIIGSLVAFLIGQIIDVLVFHKIRKWTGEKQIWLRATGSTLISQLIDSFVVLFIAFYIGAGWSFTLVLAIGMVNYIYKFVVAIALTPVIYLSHHWIDNFLGKEEADRLKKIAAQ